MSANRDPLAKNADGLIGAVSRRLRWRAYAGVAAVAVIILAVVIARREPSERPDLQLLVAAVTNAPVRLVEGRLTGGFPYGSSPSPTRGAGDAKLSPDLRIAAATIEKAYAARPTPGNLAAMGVATLALGELDRAVDMLTRAVAQESRAPYHSDLAAAYLARAVRDDRPEDYPKALASAERALRSSPGLVEALFNKALALAAMNLVDEARVARREYLARDGRSAWSREVEQRQRRSEPQDRLSLDLAAEWDRALDQRDPRRAAALTRASVQRARDYFELRLLDAWAAAVRRHDTATARQILTRMTLLGEAIAEHSGDRVALDTATDIASATRGDAGRLQTLADGTMTYVEGRRLYERDAVGQSREAFARAFQQLRAASSPLRVWPGFYDCLRYYYAASADEGVACFDTIHTMADRAGDHLVAGHCRWMTGLLRSAQSRQIDAIEAYREALGRLRAAGDHEGVASLESLIADSFDVLGDEIESWRHRHRALVSLDAHTSYRRRHTILRGAARAQMDASSEAAYCFQSAVLANATAWGRPGAVGEALLGQAQVAVAAGDLARATGSMQAAEAVVRTIPDPTIAARLRAEVVVGQAELAARMHGDRAEGILTTALDSVQANSLGFASPRLLLSRGRARTAAGNLDGAQQDYFSGIRLLADQWRDATTDQLKVQIGQQLWTLAMEVVHQEAELRGRPFVALAVADRYRQPST